MKQSLYSRRLKVFGCGKEWARERETCTSGETSVSLSLAFPILSLAHYFQVPATQAILNNNEQYLATFEGKSTQASLASFVRHLSSAWSAPLSITTPLENLLSQAPPSGSLLKTLNLPIYAHSQLACERQTFLLARRRWGTFHEEERLRLSNRNSILMTQNLSGIRSEALIGRWSSFIVLAIVYEWETKDKRPQRSNVNAMNL